MTDAPVHRTGGATSAHVDTAETLAVSLATSRPAAEPLALEPGAPPGRHPTRRAVFVLVGLLTIAAVVLALTDPFSASSPRSTGTVATSFTTVTRRALSSQTQVDATLGYAGSFSVVNQAHGTITSLPGAGSVIQQGQVLYQVDGQPVVLLDGSTPAYRDLAEGAAPSDVTGPDVEELNADLVALGFATSTDLSPTSDEFGDATKVAVEALQAHLGVAETGSLTLGQVVFLPGPARVTSVTASLGSSAQPGQPIMTATSTARQVSIQLDASLQGSVKVGDPVTITLPDNSTTPGVIASVGTVAATSSGSGGGSGGGSSAPTIDVEVTPTDPAATGSFDQAPVQVSITNDTVEHALVVPVDTLLALANGGYALEVVPRRGPHHLVAVTTGLFDDAAGLVQVTGTGLRPGLRVVRPVSP